MSLQWPVASGLSSASTESLPPAKRISRRSVMLTISIVPSGRQPSPDGWPGTSTMVSALPASSTVRTWWT